MPQVTDSASKPVAKMSVEDVCQWLQTVELEACIDAVRKNHITGQMLQDLDKEALAEIGIVGMLRVKFAAALRSLLAGVFAVL